MSLNHSDMNPTPSPCVMVIFGATGDLTHRKLIPALYNLAADGELPPAVTVVVSDSSPDGPRRYDPPTDGEQGRGLQIVEALSARWGWHLQDSGKAIFAILAREV